MLTIFLTLIFLVFCWSDGEDCDVLESKILSFITFLCFKFSAYLKLVDLFNLIWIFLPVQVEIFVEKFKIAFKCVLSEVGYLNVKISLSLFKIYLPNCVLCLPAVFVVLIYAIKPFYKDYLFINNLIMS